LIFFFSLSCAALQNKQQQGKSFVMVKMLVEPRANHFNLESTLLSSEIGSEPKIARSVRKIQIKSSKNQTDCSSKLNK
jgi:hypothetical protein